MKKLALALCLVPSLALADGALPSGRYRATLTSATCTAEKDDAVGTGELLCSFVEAMAIEDMTMSLHSSGDTLRVLCLRTGDSKECEEWTPVSYDHIYDDKYYGTGSGDVFETYSTFTISRGRTLIKEDMHSHDGSLYLRVEYRGTYRSR